MSKSASMWRLVGLLLLFMLVPIIPFVVIGELPGEEWLSQAGNAPIAFASVGALLLLADVLLPIPSSVVGVLVGGKVGLALGTVAIAVGLTGGHCIGYWLGRLWPKKWAVHAPSEPSFWMLLLSRPVPVIAEAFTFAAGAMEVPFAVFLRAILPGNVAYALTLAAIGAALLPEGAYAMALAVLLALSGLSMWLWKRSRSRAAAAERS